MLVYKKACLPRSYNSGDTIPMMMMMMMLMSDFLLNARPKRVKEMIAHADVH